MRWKQSALLILAVTRGDATGRRRRADQFALVSPVDPEPHKFSLVGGRVVCNNNNGVWMFGMPKQVSTNGQVREQINFNGNGLTTGSLAYTYQRGRQGRSAE